MELIEHKIHQKIIKYINYEEVTHSIVNTQNSENLQNTLKVKKLMFVANLGLLNNIRRINKFHEEVNRGLQINGIYLSCGETLEERKKRIYTKVKFPLRNLFLIIDFIFKRALPKIPGIKQLYFIITKGHNRVISKAEMLGRVISCGFDIQEYFEHNNLFYMISKKVREPYYDMNASYSLIFKMRRVGINGSLIYIYKIRTMYPYSEYLQKNIINEKGYDKKGKIKDDYRLTYWGKYLRKYWLDELPQLFNLLKGEMKLMGVRPLSLTRFNELPVDIQKSRIKHKPGCIPPYVSLLMADDKQNIEAEQIYLNEKEYSHLTDFKYFWLAIYNIITGKIRSK